MANKKALGPGYITLYERMDSLLDELIIAFNQGALAWPVVPRQSLLKLWRDFSRHGRVRNPRALEQACTLMRDNVARLAIANVVSGHEVMDPGSLLEGRLEETRWEVFTDWLVDDEEGWRISDYGLGPLQDAMALALEAETPEACLKYLDRALHVTHQRGDLSRLLVEGGRSTLNELAEIDE